MRSETRARLTIRACFSFLALILDRDVRRIRSFYLEQDGIPVKCTCSLSHTNRIVRERQIHL